MKKETRFLLSLLAFLLVLPASAAAGVFDEPEVIEDTVAEEIELATMPTHIENFITIDLGQFTERAQINDFLDLLQEKEINTILVALRDPVSGCVYYTSHDYNSDSCAGYETSNNIGKYFFYKADKEDFEIIAVLPAFYDKYFAERKEKYQMKAIDLETGERDFVPGWISPFNSHGYRHILGNAKAAAYAYQKYLDGFYYSHLYFPVTGADMSDAALAKFKKDNPGLDYSNLIPGTAEWDVFLTWRSDRLVQFAGILKKVVKRIMPDAYEFGAVFPSESAISPKGYEIYPKNGIDFAKMAGVNDFRILFNLDWQSIAQEDRMGEIKNILNLMSVWNPILSPVPVFSTRRTASETILLEDEYAEILSEIKEYMMSQWLGYAVFYAEEPWTEITLREVSNIPTESEIQLHDAANLF